MLGITDEVLYAKWRNTQKEVFLEALSQNIPDPFRTGAIHAKKHLLQLFAQIIPARPNHKHRNLTEAMNISQILNNVNNPSTAFTGLTQGSESSTVLSNQQMHKLMGGDSDHK